MKGNNGSSGWWILAGLAGLVVVKNPKILEWLIAFGEGLNAHAEKKARQLLETQQQEILVLPTPEPTSEPAKNEFTEAFLADWREKIRAPSLLQHVPPVDEPLAQLVHHPSVVLILGHRDSGKTALAIRLQELLRSTAAPYSVGLPPKAKKLLPDWYGLAQDFETIPNDSVIYIPESHRFFHARDTRSAQGRTVANLVNLSRHRQHTLIFDVQNAAQLDRNIISEADLVLVKQPGPFQQGFERTQFNELMDGARAGFSGLGKGKKKQSVWVVAPSDGINGQLMENQLPSFWTNSLSRIFGESSVSIRPVIEEVSHQQKRSSTSDLRLGKKTPTQAMRTKARQMRNSGYSYAKIGSILGCSKSYAYKLVHG